MINIKEKW